MNETEFELLAAAIKSAYPNSKVLLDKYGMRTWYKALMDLDYKVAENAIWEHISTSVFPPSIADIREKCTARLQPMVTDWGEAWEEVQRAIRRYGSYQEDAALASLSRLTAVAVRRMGFKNLCLSENPVADRAHFQRMYEGMVKEEKHQTQLPKFVEVERSRMIEANILSKVRIGENNSSIPTDGKETPKKDRSSPEFVEQLVEAAKRSLGSFLGSSEGKGNDEQRKNVFGRREERK